MFFGSKVLGAIESSFDSATKYYTEVTKKLGANDFKGPIAQLALKKQIIIIIIKAAHNLIKLTLHLFLFFLFFLQKRTEQEQLRLHIPRTFRNLHHLQSSRRPHRKNMGPAATVPRATSAQRQP